MPARPQGKAAEGADARCPHVAYRGVLGARAVADLLDHVTAHERKFRPGPVRTRGIDRKYVDLERRDCLLLPDLGPVGSEFEAFVRDITPHALAQLGLVEAAVEPREFEISAHGDGGHFKRHVDTTDVPERVRILSCVYYFSQTPRRFQGGELRLYGFPNPFAATPPATFVDIEPETDFLIVFPSWLEHEVRPVRVPSGAWADRRFAINCWLLRANPASGGKATA